MLRVLFVVIPLLFAVSFPALACDRWDLAGVYRTFSITTGLVNATEKCELRIGLDGKIGSGSFCKLHTVGGFKETNQVTGGSFDINNICRVTGTIRFASGPSQFDAWLSQDGQVITGNFNANGIAILLTGVKRP